METLRGFIDSIWSFNVEDITTENAINLLQDHPRLVLVTLVLVTGRIYIGQRYWTYWSKRGVSGPAPGLMEYGNFGAFMQLLESKSEPLTDKYGGQFGFYIGRTPFLFVSDVSLMKEINIKQFSKFPQRSKQSGMDTALGEVAKDFMTYIIGPQWKRVRHSTVPLMTASKLNEILPMVVDAAKMASSQIEENTDYECKKLSFQYSIRAIMSATFGIDASDKDAMDVAAYHADNVSPDNAGMGWTFIYGMIPESIRFKLGLSLMPKPTQKYFNQLFDQIFASPTKRKCFMTQMMANIIPEDQKFDPKITKGFTKSEVMANALLVIIAGFETTASVLQFMVFVLCKYPAVQEELFRETQKRDINNYEEVRDFKLLDAIIKETMRLYPSSLINLRHCVETTDIKEGLTIEKGTNIVWSNLRFQMDEEYYSEPEKFDHTRWEGNESNTLQDDAWFGFGQGPRACPGVRLAFIFLKVYMMQIVSDWRVVRTTDTPEDVNATIRSFKLVSDKPLIVKFEKR